MGLLHSSCDRLLLVTSVTSSLFVAQGLLSRCSVPEGSSLDLAGKSSPVLARSSSVCHWGLLPCDSIGLLSSCGGGLGVPLELRQVTWSSFRVVVGPPLEPHGAAPF